MAQPLGLYSQASRDTHSGLIFVAGQVALAPDGSFVGEGDLARQARQTFSNIGAALHGAGADWKDLLRLTTYLTRSEDYGAFREIRNEIFNELFPDGRYPPHTLLVVAALSAPEHLIEVDAIAVGPIV